MYKRNTTRGRVQAEQRARGGQHGALQDLTRLATLGTCISVWQVASGGFFHDVREFQRFLRTVGRYLGGFKT